MTIIRVQKARNNTNWKPLTKNSYVCLEERSGEFRIVVKNLSGVIANESRKAIFVLAEDTDKTLIKEEYEAITEVLFPILKKFHESKQTLKMGIEEINALLEGIVERMEKREKLETKKRKKRGKKGYNQRKKTENYLLGFEDADGKFDEESDLDTLPEVSDDDDEWEISDDDDDVDNGPNSVQSIDDVEEILRHYGHDVKHIKRCVGRYKKNKNTVGDNSRDVAQACQRIEKLDKKLGKFFFENKRKKKSAKKKNLFEKLRNHYNRQKEDAHEVINSRDVHDLTILAQNYSLSNTGVGRKIKKAKQKRQKKIEEIESKEIVGDEGVEENVIEGGGGGGLGMKKQAQSQKQKQKYVLQLEQVNTIDTFVEVEKEKKGELLKLHSDMNELVDMMQDMKYMVKEQGEDINDIQDSIERSIYNVERGRKEIRTARGYQKLGMGKLITKGGVSIAGGVGKAVVGGLLK